MLKRRYFAYEGKLELIFIPLRACSKLQTKWHISCWNWPMQWSVMNEILLEIIIIHLNCFCLFLPIFWEINKIKTVLQSPPFWCVASQMVYIAVIRTKNLLSAVTLYQLTSILSFLSFIYQVSLSIWSMYLIFLLPLSNSLTLFVFSYKLCFFCPCFCMLSICILPNVHIWVLHISRHWCVVHIW